MSADPVAWWGGHEEDPAVKAAMMAGASQDGWELTRALALIAKLPPQVIVEIGCDRGGTLLAWRAICQRVYGITLASNSPDTGGSGLPLVAYGAKVHTGDSHQISSRDWLLAELARDDGEWPASGRGIDVLVLDGDHSHAGVRMDLRMYGPLVRPGGVILLHDIYSEPRLDVPVEVAQVWPELAARYVTETIANPDGGYGWGVIRAREEDTFDV